MKMACNRAPLCVDDLASQPMMSRLENAVSRTTLYRIAGADAWRISSRIIKRISIPTGRRATLLRRTSSVCLCTAPPMFSCMPSTKRRCGERNFPGRNSTPSSYGYSRSARLLSKGCRKSEFICRRLVPFGTFTGGYTEIYALRHDGPLV